MVKSLYVEQGLVWHKCLKVIGGFRMNDVLAKFIRVKHIDSFQKLRLLIFLHQHPESTWGSQQIAEELYLDDVPLLEEIINDLREVGLVNCVGNRCRLRDEPTIRSCLECLAATYEDPLGRQQILGLITRDTSYAKRGQENTHEPH
jgi:hypothetical protein